MPGASPLAIPRPALGQSASELEGRVGSRAGRIAAADGGQLRLAKRLEVAVRIERDGAVAELCEQPGIFGSVNGTR